MTESIELRQEQQRKLDHAHLSYELLSGYNPLKDKVELDGLGFERSRLMWGLAIAIKSLKEDLGLH